MHCGDPSLKTLGYVCSILGHVTNEKLVSFQEKSSALFVCYIGYRIRCMHVIYF